MKTAWERPDSNLITNVFTRNVSYQEDPFGKKIQGLDSVVNYRAQVPKFQKKVKFTYSRVFHLNGSIWGTDWKHHPQD